MRTYLVTWGPDDWGKHVQAPYPHPAAVAYTGVEDLPSLRQEDDEAGPRWVGFAEDRGEIAVYLVQAEKKKASTKKAR